MSKNMDPAPFKSPESNHEEIKRVARIIKRDQLLQTPSENKIVYYMIGSVLALKVVRVIWDAMGK